jgi:CheY-like chemotaxis protein
VPIIGLTGDDVRTNPSIEEDARKVGMNSVITKPIDMNQLNKLMSSL